MQHWPENSMENKEMHPKRHKTRLGLTMLIRLTKGDERRVESRLLEHMALLEGMLDRLRFSCIEAINVNGQTNSKAMLLSERLYRSSSRFIVSLLRLLIDVNENANLSAPLLWHDVLLNTVNVEDKRNNLIFYSLEHMCQLLDELDTKSTNFFLSTVVTAVLTYHLGWIYTVLPPRDRQAMEKLGCWYPCNPLWAQLGDLHGAIGNPVKVAHTVVAGDCRKLEQINSVLSFLSYFIRSGRVQKRRESRADKEKEFLNAISALEQARIKRPYLFNQPKASQSLMDRDKFRSRRESRSDSRKILSESRSYDMKEERCDLLHRSPSQYNLDQARTNHSVSPLKRSSTTKSNLDSLMLKPSDLEVHNKLSVPELPREQDDSERYEFPNESMKNWPPSKVKIIVSESRDSEEAKSEEDSGLSVQNLVKKLEFDDTGDDIVNHKLRGHERQENFQYDTLKVYTQPYEFESGQSIDQRNKNPQVMFMLGEDEKMTKTLSRPRLGYNCQCSYTFSRVPSTSAQLPEGVLRKIIQRNFPESAKSMQPPPDAATSVTSKPIGFCEKCNGLGFLNSQSYDICKQVLETPTNATEVLRTCGSSVSDGNLRLSRSNSLEALMEASGVVELPMPRSKKLEKTDTIVETGFTKTLLQTKLPKDGTSSTSVLDVGYTWGLVLQGLVKKKKRRKKVIEKTMTRMKQSEAEESENERNWWYCMREECFAGVRFPIIDQPVAEALHIVADLDTCHVGILSNNAPMHSAPLPVGMSRLVSNMLEAFSYVWRKYHSPSHCIWILETKLREMWLRSEVLAEMLMATQICDATVANLTSALDLEAADLPLLLAVATAHTPEIAQRFGLTLT